MFEPIFEAASVALLFVDSERRIRLANREAERMFGYERGELVDMATEVLLPSRFRERHFQLVTAFLGDPTARRMAGRDLVGLRKDGTELPVEVGLTPMPRPDGMYVLASVVDITARLRAEDRFRAAFEAAPNAMIMVDAKGCILLVNSQTEALFGYTRAEMLGQRIEMLVPAEERARHPAFVKVYLAAPTPRPMGSGRDLQAQRKDGSRFPVEIGLRPFHGPDGDYVISSVVDISERVRDRARLMDRNEELEQFAYRTSHDLRAPIELVLAHFRALRSQPTRITQILDNLISNGVKFADTGKPERRVTVRTFNDARHFQLQVEDNGVGIPLARHPEVFSIFKRFHADNRPGSGLGLYLVKRHVLKLEGTIEFGSSEAGTTFHVELPLRPRDRSKGGG